VAHLVNEPAISDSVLPRSGGVDELWGERLHPPVDRDMINLTATFGQ
jgi:hypothetical protein